MINFKKEKTALNLVPKVIIQKKNVCVSMEPRETISKRIKNVLSNDIKEIRENLTIYSSKMAEKKRSNPKLSSKLEVKGERRSCKVLPSNLKLDDIQDSTKMNFHFQFFKKPYRNTKREYLFPEAKISSSTTDKFSQSTLHEEINDRSETSPTVHEEVEFTYKEKESESFLCKGVESSIVKHSEVRIDKKGDGTLQLCNTNKKEEKKKESRKSVKEIVEISKINEIVEKNNGRRIDYKIINKSREDFLRSSESKGPCCSNSRCTIF